MKRTVVCVVVGVLCLLCLTDLWAEGTLARPHRKTEEELKREKAEDREKFLKQNRAARAANPPKPKRAKIDAKPVFAIDLGTESTKVVVGKLSILPHLKGKSILILVTTKS